MSGVGPRTANTFNSGAPANYVAGVGRGAMGFTTRSDIGPARPMVEGPSAGGTSDPQFGAAPAGYVAGLGRGMGDLARSQADAPQLPTDHDRGDYSESNYDEFSGYGEKLFSANTPYDEDDAEADKIYDKVDSLMDSRRKRSREQQLLLQQQNSKNSRVRIADQFADLKRDLSTVSAAEWDAIPEVGDHSLKLKQSRKKETFTPAPDFIIQGYSDRSILGTQETSSGYATVSSGLAEARGVALSSRLDGMSDDVSGQTVVDPKGYLTSLATVKVNTMAEVGDIKRAEHLLKSVITTNPKHGPGWIAAARVQEHAQKFVQARKIILEGCSNCPENEDVWLEAARLHQNLEDSKVAKTILANAVKSLPKSVKIWLAAAELETPEKKKLVLRKALEFIPGSVKLWKAVVELENVEGARIMLARAVECVPESIEMWLALAKLENHDRARQVLNEAREKNPTERLTWITAAKLEEAHNNFRLVDTIIEKMVISLEQYDVAISRDVWIQEAEDCEHSGSPRTCHAIIKNTIHLGVEKEDRMSTWMDDAETCLQKAPVCKETARAVYNYALVQFPTKKTLWQCAAMLEKEHGTPKSLEQKLLEGVKACPHGEVLWLMAAKEAWLSTDPDKTQDEKVQAARGILKEAFTFNPKSEQIVLAAVKLEWENNEFKRAQDILSQARAFVSTERVYLKSALLEFEMQDYDATITLLKEAIEKYPTFAKYYLMLGQVYDLKKADFQQARQAYQNGIKKCAGGVVEGNGLISLWRSLIYLDEKRCLQQAIGIAKARTTCENARREVPKNDAIWLECIRFERRNNTDNKGNVSNKLADNLMSRALQECPTSEILLAEELLTCPKTSQKSKCIAAMEKCPNNVLILTTVARLLERSHRILKARKYYVRALNVDKKYGDAYVYYYICEYVRIHKKKLIQEGLLNGINSAINGNNNNNADKRDVATEDVEDIVEIDDDGDEEDEEEGQVDETLMDVNEDQQHSAADLQVLSSIVQQCSLANPNTGELWNSFTKSDVRLRRADPPTKLKALVEHVLGFKLSSFSHNEQN